MSAGLGDEIGGIAVQKSASTRLTAGKVLIALVAAETAIGPYIADWNESHIYNPSWPPHAKFHNGQTMSMGAGLALASFAQLLRHNDSRGDALRALDAASLSAALYWLTSTSALVYPGAKAVDPPGTARFPQWKFVVPSLVLVAAGNVLERRRLRRETGAVPLVLGDSPRHVRQSLHVVGLVRAPGTSTALPWPIRNLR